MPVGLFHPFRFARLVPVFTAALLVVDCNALDSPTFTASVAIISMGTTRAGAGFTTTPTVTALRQPREDVIFTVSGSATDRCELITLTASDTELRHGDAIGAGAQVVLQWSGSTNRIDTLTHTSETAKYQVTAGRPALAFTPGDSVVFTLPGSATGLAALTVAVRTAESFTYDFTPNPGSSASTVQLKWSAPPVPGSDMLVKFDWDAGSTQKEVFCVLRDIGSGTVTTSLLTEYYSYNQGLGNLNPQPKFTRLRAATYALTGSSGFATVSSTFAVPTQRVP